MVHVLAVPTAKLAEAIGLDRFAAGAGLVLAPARRGAMVDGFDRSPALAPVTGIAASWIGAGILIAHHIAADPLAAVLFLAGFTGRADYIPQGAL